MFSPQKFLEKLDLIEELPAAPMEPVEENDHIVGQLSEGLRLAYSLRKSASKNLIDAIRVWIHLTASLIEQGLITSESSSPQEDKLVEMARAAAKNIVIVEQLFILCVKTDFPALPINKLVLRTDWQIGWNDNAPRPMPQVLFDLFKLTTAEIKM